MGAQGRAPLELVPRSHLPIEQLFWHCKGGLTALKDSAGSITDQFNLSSPEPISAPLIKVKPNNNKRETTTNS